MWPMDQQNWLAEQFEAQRKHLQAVAYRMLGSLNEAEDAVQETWLRFSRTDASSVQNLGGWLTTIVSRVCVDMMRSRKSRREELAGPDLPAVATNRDDGTDPEQEALMAESVGLAMLVVLDRLTPAERIAFVLHDIFALSFTEIAPIVNRTEAAARQLASRARRRVHGEETAPNPDRENHRKLVDAFLTASKTGDFVALLNVLDPDVILRNDPAFIPAALSPEIRGAESVAKQFLGRAQSVRPLLINGDVGAVAASRGRLWFVLAFSFRNGKITHIELIADAKRVGQLELAVLSD